MLLLKLRNRHFFLLDVLVMLLTPLAALMVRLDTFTIPREFWLSLALYTLAALGVRLFVFRRMGLYARYWRYASVEELVQMVTAVIISTTLLTTGTLLLRAFAPFVFARSVLLVDGLLVLLAVGGLRFSVRAFSQNSFQPDANRRRVLIMGAGDAGEMVVREMKRRPNQGLLPVAFLDDDPAKHHLSIHGVPVLGSRKEIPRLVAQYKIDQIILAMPTATGATIREVVGICEMLGVETRIVPSLPEILLQGRIRPQQLRRVQIEDLLRREPVQTDIQAVRALVSGKRVLVTGAGGSIGGELCRQLLQCGPRELLLLGHGENSVFEIYHELHGLELHGPHVTPLIADVRFAERLLTLFEQHRPEIVFHAAAHKHVPLMELNPAEAITNNVLGTRNLLAAALAVDVAHFVMISTDKAVNPTSIMGASKRAAELLVHQAARRSGRPYVAVRFGNVLGSRGSVVLTFQKQIARGGPITVTHPDIRRFFMTIPEATQLVLQAAVLGQGGEVFVLDMGEPVKIVDLAKDLIRLSGLEPGKDVAIEYVGLRPGEKLYEELFIPGEDYRRTTHAKIFIATNASSFMPADLDGGIAQLAQAAARNDADAIRRGLRALAPEFASPNGQTAVVPPPAPAGQTAPPAAAAPESVRTTTN